MRRARKRSSSSPGRGTPGRVDPRGAGSGGGGLREVVVPGPRIGHAAATRARSDYCAGSAFVLFFLRSARATPTALRQQPPRSRRRPAPSAGSRSASGRTACLRRRRRRHAGQDQVAAVACPAPAGCRPEHDLAEAEPLGEQLAGSGRFDQLLGAELGRGDEATPTAMRPSESRVRSSWRRALAASVDVRRHPAVELGVRPSRDGSGRESTTSWRAPATATKVTCGPRAGAHRRIWATSSTMSCGARPRPSRGARVPPEDSTSAGQRGRARRGAGRGRCGSRAASRVDRQRLDRLPGEVEVPLALVVAVQAARVEAADLARDLAHRLPGAELVEHAAAAGERIHGSLQVEPRRVQHHAGELRRLPLVGPQRDVSPPVECAERRRGRGRRAR